MREEYTGIDLRVIEVWIFPRETEIRQMNTWIDHEDKASLVNSGQDEYSLTFAMPDDSNHRKMIYEYLNDKYPYLKVDLIKFNELNYQMKVSRDASYVSLFDTLHLDDLKTLYTFKNQRLSGTTSEGILIGSHSMHPIASTALIVFLGEYLSKSERSQVYNIITKTPRMDSRTVDVKGENTKAMYIYFKGTKKRQRTEASSTSFEYDEKAMSTLLSIRRKDNVCIYFTLMKINMEQLDAFQRIIQYLSPHIKFSPNDFKYAGIKDKRARTYQKISLSVDHKLSRNKAEYEFQLYTIVKMLLEMNKECLSTSSARSMDVANFTFESMPLQLGGK